MRIYSHLSLVVANEGGAMGFYDRLEGCVVEVAGSNPTGQLGIPDAVVAFISKCFLRRDSSRISR